jgi:diaminohydroxyphosphoribosylaminopyrimidine deaminase/5-amino-6-(5-phosphoribosylamino)uracil reductase
MSDNPRLNVRRWSGDNPVRITMDRKGRLSGSSNILDGKQDTIVFAGIPGQYSGKTRSIHVDPSYELGDLLEELFDQQIISVLVEGGAQLLESFLKSGLWDEARVFTGKMSFSQGVNAPELHKTPDETLVFNDTKLEYYNNRDDLFYS